MDRFIRGLKAGVAAFKQGADPREYSIAGRRVRCPHCGNARFAPARALLNTSGLTFLNFDWADPSATILVCSECSRIEWFAQKPDDVEDPV